MVLLLLNSLKLKEKIMKKLFMAGCGMMMLCGYGSAASLDSSICMRISKAVSDTQLAMAGIGSLEKPRKDMLKLSEKAPGMEQVLTPIEGKKPRYKKLIVSRPVQPMGKDIGFLPGSMEEKMLPWLAPIKDNLEFLVDDDRDALAMYLERRLIEIEALTYIRGRSISNAFIIIDEAQNLTSHELKTIITRVGEGTKIVLTGDIEQIDNAYIDQTSNGLTYAVEKFKSYDLSGHVTLRRGERSKVATLAAKIL